MKRSPTLRQIFGAGSFLLTLLALVCAFALAFYPNELRTEIDDTRKVVGTLHNSSELTANVTRFARRSILYGIHRRPADLSARNRAELQILKSLGHLKQNALSAEAKQVADQIENDLQSFIAERKNIDESRSPSTASALEGGLAPFESTLRQIETFNALNLKRVDEIGVRANEIDRLTDVLAAALAAIFLLAFALTLFIARSYLYRPLRQLGRTMRLFSSGYRDVRAYPSGARELMEIGVNFNAMADDLKLQEQRRFEFLAGVAHDLRNPLSALKMAAELLAHETKDRGAEQGRGTTMLIGRQIERIDRMIQDLFDATRIQAGHLKLAIKDQDLRATINECVDVWRPSSSRHEIVVTMPKVPITVPFDAGRMAQVLNNLLSNAIKFSPGGGKILVSAKMFANDHVELSVTDHGIGIADSEASQVFRPFHRTAIAQAEKIPGVGLGLAVSKKIVEAHGGTISLESTVGHGSTFKVRLPVVAAKAA